MFNFLFGRLSYTIKATLKDHTAPVNALAFSDKGLVLASGGDDGQVHLYDTKTLNRFQTLSDANDKWGQITTLQFSDVDRAGSLTEVLWVGTGKGQIVAYRRSHTTPSFVLYFNIPASTLGDSIEFIATDPWRPTFAISTHWGNVALYDLDHDKVTRRWELNTGGKIPRGLCYIRDGTELVIMTMDDGTMIVRDADTKKPGWAKVLDTPIGSVACRVLKDDKVQVLVDNMKSGFDLFVIDHSAEHLVRYPVPNGERYTRSGAFGGEKDLVVCGSHKGRAFLYNLNSGTLLGTLKHAGSSGMIQTVAASRSSKEYLIATGAANGKHDVKIWSKQRPSGQEGRKDCGGQYLLNMMFLAFILFLTTDSWVPSAITLLDRIVTQAPASTRMLQSSLKLVGHKESDRGSRMTRALLSMDDEILRDLRSSQADTEMTRFLRSMDDDALGRFLREARQEQDFGALPVALAFAQVPEVMDGFVDTAMDDAGTPHLQKEGVEVEVERDVESKESVEE